MARFAWVTASATVLFTATLVNTHMTMKSPIPYGLSSLDNSPLATDGSDFPCKQRPGVYDSEGAENILTVGEPNTLSFQGSAVHGGGSCQVSLSADLRPTKSSTWMVIKSIEGGCPASVPGNLPTDPDGDGASAFLYTIPEGIAPGQYTIAWSWLNKIGNREFYMNCGPVTVVRPKKKKRYTSDLGPLESQISFPEMYVANLASVNECASPEAFDYRYPDPGNDVQSAGTGPFIQLTCDGSSRSASRQANATSTVSVDLVTTISESEEEVTRSLSLDMSALSTDGQNTFASSTGCHSQPSRQPSKPGGSVGTFSAAAYAGVDNTGLYSSAYSGSCSIEGAWLCSSDGKWFQRCGSGVWSVPIPLEGTKCNPGISVKFVLDHAEG